MKEFIFGERNGIYIIDLQKTQRMFKEAIKFVTDLTGEGTRQDHSLRRHEATGTGCDQGRSRALQSVLHQPALARRTAHQFPDDSEVDQAI